MIEEELVFVEKADRDFLKVRHPDGGVTDVYINSIDVITRVVTQRKWWLGNSSWFNIVLDSGTILSCDADFNDRDFFVALWKRNVLEESE